MAVQVPDVEGAGEVVAQVVARPHLQRLAVAHQRLAGERVVGAGEALARRLLTRDDRDRQRLLHERPVHLEHAPGLLGRVRIGGVGGVALLPEELGGAQEQPWPQLPTDHVVPEVEHQRKVPVGLDPLGEVVIDDRLGGGAHHQRLDELFPAGVGDHGQLRGEALDVLLLLLQEARRDEERERDVPGARLLDPPVHVGLHELPDRVAPRPDDHGSPHRAVLGQLGARDDLLIPGGEVLRLRGEYGLGHGAASSCLTEPRQMRRPIHLRHALPRRWRRPIVDDGAARLRFMPQTLAYRLDTTRGDAHPRRLGRLTERGS